MDKFYRVGFCLATVTFLGLVDLAHAIPRIDGPTAVAVDENYDYSNHLPIDCTSDEVDGIKSDALLLEHVDGVPRSVITNALDSGSNCYDSSNDLGEACPICSNRCDTRRPNCGR
jgi:hypothetical protein